MKTKTLKFHNTEITFVEYAGDGSMWIVPAKLLGKAMGYANEGQGLADLVTNNWGKKMTAADWRIIEGTELAELKKQTAKYNVDFKQANSLLFLSMSGVIFVLMKSNATMAKDFRNWFAKNGGELLEGRKLAPVKPAKALKRHAATMSLAGPSALEDIFKTIATMSKYGLLKNEEKKALLGRVLETQMVKLQKDLGVTHFVHDPNSPIAPFVGTGERTIATPTGNYQLIEGSMRHPDFLNWKPASDIASMVGLTKDTIKKYISAYCVAKGEKLPNVEVQELIKAAGGQFMPPDSHGFLKHRNMKLGGMAIYHRMADNKLVWRNFWSEEAVAEIIKLVNAKKNGTVQEVLPLDEPNSETSIQKV